jgi:hypothetical protein
LAHVTELLSGPAEVRLEPGSGSLRAVRMGGRWRAVTRVANRWVVETDWWRTPVRRHYVRLLLGKDECVELYHDLDTGTWHWSRRYD